MAETDEDYLDDVFDRMLDELLGGTTPDVEALVAGREHLQDRTRELLGLARAVAGTRSAPPAMARSIGGFELIEELGRGASSVVWLARQQAVGGRLVALKLLARGPVDDPRAQRRFAAEVRALARVRHQHVVPIHDVVETEEAQGYAMEWVRGQSLADLIRRHHDGSSTGAHDPAALRDARYVLWVCRLGIQLGRALQAVHEAGLLHRDVKPSNVLLGDRGEALLSDFGLVHDAEASQHTRTGVFLGTLAYSPPEQLRGAAIDARADIYALGATLYHALAMAPPVTGNGVAAVLAHLEGRGIEPLRRLVPLLPRDLETVIQKAMAPEPYLRYATAADLADDLQRVLDLLPIAAVRPGPWRRARRLLRRHRAVVSGLVAGLLLSVAALMITAWQQGRAAQRRLEVERLVERARLSLFDERLGARIRAQVRSGQPADAAATMRLLQNTDDVYRPALELAPERDDLCREVETLRLAAARLAADDVEPTPAFARDCPVAVAWHRDGVAAVTDLTHATDARALGVLAYVTGDLDIAVQALEWLEQSGAGDVFTGGLLGPVLAARGEPARALPRLLRLAEAFPARGGLQVEAGIAAAACGERPAAERL
ncbi:MAG: serine/threonine protein kinase, partial [Planctomycetes bacterium]|nr:serine/threonine protein kinase [Planctomycetota bacterium]